MSTDRLDEYSRSSSFSTHSLTHARTHSKSLGFEVDPVWRFSIPHSDPLGPPIIAVNDVSFDYTQTLPDGSPKPKSQYLLQDVNFGVTLTSKIAVLGANGQGKVRHSFCVATSSLTESFHESPCWKQTILDFA